MPVFLFVFQFPVEEEVVSDEALFSWTPVLIAIESVLAVLGNLLASWSLSSSNKFYFCLDAVGSFIVNSYLCITSGPGRFIVTHYKGASTVQGYGWHLYEYVKENE